MDGMDRVYKALSLGHDSIAAIQPATLPEPDFVGAPADELSDL